MNTEQILKVLKNERECIENIHDWCYENCDKSCPYYVSEAEKIEVLDFLIEAYSITEIHINVSQEEADKLFEIINRMANDHTRLAVLPYPDVGECYPTVTFDTAPDVTARAIFNGICPYTNIKCEKWTCSVCEVEERERKFMEGDTE